MADFSFKILKKDKKTLARLGVISTRHGKIETPYLVPVATSASIRTIDSEDLISLKAQCALANTYHLYLQPGHEIIKSFGGLQKFMNFPGPIFTDSGGFQAFSLGLGKEHQISKLGGIFPGKNSLEDAKKEKKQKKLAYITDKGIVFRSVYDGTEHYLTPELSMKIQS